MYLELAENIVKSLIIEPKSCALVDGDDEFVRLLEKVLNDLGFCVSSFIDSSEFVAANNNKRFDVVVLAWDVQPISGTQVVEMMRANGEPYPALIIECDGCESVSFQLAISPVGFLFKPFDIRQLIQILSKSIGVAK